MYMLDTNTVSYLFRQNPQVMGKLAQTRPVEVCISSITEAELLYGVAKRKSKTLTVAVQGFLGTVSVYPWDSEAAKSYGQLRAAMEKKGKVMGPLDQLIAAHALSRNATIITSDRAFAMVGGLRVEDWTL
ncbi:type II toxin-antitoxin system VapC family toxin [Buttiauxella sp.]|uniref:type II toxin-antitoxin system VapC family toxin n=1 Tax=Buttiauxella sp. TaxID=1972222 RepID=UPI003C763AE1